LMSAASVVGGWKIRAIKFITEKGELVTAFGAMGVAESVNAMGEGKQLARRA